MFGLILDERGHIFASVLSNSLYDLPQVQQIKTWLVSISLGINLHELYVCIIQDLCLVTRIRKKKVGGGGELREEIALTFTFFRLASNLALLAKHGKYLGLKAAKKVKKQSLCGLQAFPFRIFSPAYPWRPGSSAPSSVGSRT